MDQTPAAERRPPPGRDAVVVVGGGPAALATARAYREAGGQRPVALLTDEARLPYLRPALSKELLCGEVDVATLGLVDDAWYAENEVTVHRGRTVRGLDVARRRVAADGLGAFDVGACVLACGSAPLRPRLPGGDGRGVRLLRSIDDALALAADVGPATEVVVVGSGFIGCEAAVSLARRGARVRMLTPEPVPHAARLGEDAGGRVRAWLAAEGVEVRAGSAVRALREDRGRTRVACDDGAVLSADVVLAAIGAAPRLALPRRAGLTVDGGGVVVDARMQAAPGVFAVGDIAYADNPTARRHLRVEHWGEALAMGAVAGRVLAGEDDAWDAVPGFWSTVGDRTLKQAAWGDGHDTATLVEHGDAWTVWYARGQTCVGVVTHDADDDYERGREMVARGDPAPVPTTG